MRTGCCILLSFCTVFIAAVYVLLAGWCNLLGQLAITASIAFSAMLVIISMVLMLTGQTFDQYQQLAIYAGLSRLNAGRSNTDSICILWHAIRRCNV